MKRFALLLAAALLGIASLTSCVPLAAGTAGGYLLHKKGYRVQNPLPGSENVRVRSPIKRQAPAQNPPIYEDGTYPQGY